MKIILMFLILFASTVNANEQIKEEIGITEPYKIVKITSGVEGTIISYNRDIGEITKSKNLLLKIDDKEKEISRDLSKTALERAIIDKNYYQKKLKRYKKLRLNNNISEAEFDDIEYNLLSKKNEVKIKRLELKNKERDLSDTYIYGINDYVVSKRFFEVGDYVQSSTILYELIDVTKLKIKVLLNDKVISNISIGQKVFVSIGEEDNYKITGVVLNKGLAMNDDLYAYPLIIVIDNKNRDIPLSKTVSVSFEEQIQ